MANSKNHSFIEPQQERSRKRFETVLKTAEFIYENQDNYDLTVQDIAKLSGMKRPSIYKFFPNNESILEAISKKHTDRYLTSTNHPGSAMPRELPSRSARAAFHGIDPQVNP